LEGFQVGDEAYYLAVQSLLDLLHIGEVGLFLEEDLLLEGLELEVEAGVG